MLQFKKSMSILRYRGISTIITVIIIAVFLLALPSLYNSKNDAQFLIDSLAISYWQYSGGDPADTNLQDRLASTYQEVVGDAFLSDLARQIPEIQKTFDQLDLFVSALHSDPEGLSPPQALDRNMTVLPGHVNGAIKRVSDAISLLAWAGIVLIGGIGVVMLQLYRRNSTLLSEVERSVEQKSLLIAETHHRVKNNLTLVSSLLSIKEGSVDPPIDLSDVTNQINAIADIHRMLSEADAETDIRMDHYLTTLAHSVVESVTGRRIKLVTMIDPVRLPTKSATYIGIIVNEVITNALKYARPADRDRDEPLRVEVLLNTDNELQSGMLRIKDNGVGIDESQASSKASLGLLLVRTLAEQLKGSLEILNDGGTVFTVRFS